MTANETAPAGYQRIGRVLGPLAGIAMLAASDWQQSMDPGAWRVAAVALWMAIWWATEAVAVPATALLPIVLFDPLGIAPLKTAAAHYANPVIFLFLGGFLLALALERWNLHRRIALAILVRSGTDGHQLVGGVMLVAALLSMWMTNTSTTMMMLPIVLSIVAVIRDSVVDLDPRGGEHFGLAMLLGLAYAASIGGLATLIGTPPNALLVAYLAENNGLQISFARWMLVGIPVTLVMLPLAWWLLTRVLFPLHIPASTAVRDHLLALHSELGPVTRPERRVALVFLAVVAAWMLRRPLADLVGLRGVSDAGIAICGALLLFALPSGDTARRSLMTWEDTRRLPWGVLILFGGGLSLAAAVADSGLALWLGERLAPLNAWGLVALTVAAVTLVVFLTELTSNLATTATFLPVMGAIALTVGVPPILLTVPITLAASCAFMLPVATPPNAIVFSTGLVRIPQMVRAGFALNLAAIVVVTLIAFFVAPGLLQPAP